MSIWNSCDALLVFTAFILAAANALRATVPEVTDEFGRIFPTAIAVFDEFDHVQTPFPQFTFGNVAVGTANLLAELTLRQTCIHTHPTQQIKKVIVRG